MSLQSTYQSRKALLAENLETMGVTGYSENDGLTTLINAVLEIGPTPPTPTPASISLTADKSILSYADTESAVLTATVLDENDDPVEGVTVNLYNGATLWDTLTTDSSGECSKTYSSAGVGDITFTAEVDGTLLTKTFVVQDCDFYDALTENHNKWTVTGSLQYNEHTSNGWKYGAVDGLVWIDINNFSLTEGANIEFTPTESYSGSSGNYAPIMVYFENPSQSRVYFVQANTFIQMNSSTKTNHNINLGTEHRIEYTGTTLKFYLGDTLVGSASHNLGTSNIKVRLTSGGNRYCRIKDFKIKPL